MYGAVERDGVAVVGADEMVGGILGVEGGGVVGFVFGAGKGL